MTYNVFTADTLHHTAILTFDRLTLNVCCDVIQCL